MANVLRELGKMAAPAGSSDLSFLTYPSYLSYLSYPSYLSPD
jgi:hypothetical protein